MNRATNQPPISHYKTKKPPYAPVKALKKEQAKMAEKSNLKYIRRSGVYQEALIERVTDDDLGPGWEITCIRIDGTVDLVTDDGKACPPLFFEDLDEEFEAGIDKALKIVREAGFKSVRINWEQCPWE